ncbi:MAG: hypothetical protein RLZZ561_418 [Pseudomonadota bacterium]
MAEPNLAPHLSGLSDEEAARRRDVFGPNELPPHGHRGIWRILVDVMREPMLALLIAGGIIYLILGSRHEALILLAFACLSILITVAQEARTEHALEALRDLTSPRALVVRNGKRKRIAGRDVVPGDVLFLTEGDRVPADGLVLTNDALEADESLLTGEAFAVRKIADKEGSAGVVPRPGGHDQAFVYSGSMIVRGAALCRVIATGPHSEIGKIGHALSAIETEAPQLQRQTRHLVWWMAIVGGAVSLLSTLLYGLMRGSWLEAALSGIAIGMSMLPEEFPVVLTVFLAMGAIHMSRAQVLTRRASAIETLGAATILCTDKTGTLTENRMRVAEMRLPDGQILVPQTGLAPLGAAFQNLAELGILASAEQPVDPMEMAFHALGTTHPDQHLHSRQQAGWTLRHHYPVKPQFLAMSHVWGTGGSQDHVIASKGAPEAIADLCDLDGRHRKDVRQQVDAMAKMGLRVLAVAEARWPSQNTLPATQHLFAFEFRGLVGLTDPVRPSVPEAVRQCQQAGIRVVMMTGDYPGTALAIAAQAGIAADNVVTGDLLADMGDAELVQCVAATNVFARIMPEQKLRIVEALKAQGEIVAMTGDGVNDAPSLKAAHIGIAMGERGTDVAREAAALVLLNDDFESIVRAIRLGRRIYDNLRKAMGFIVAAHIPIAGLALLPLFTGLPLLLGPIHIAVLEMVIDPVCALVFEAEIEEPDVMQRPPRPSESPLFSRQLIGWSLLQGSIVMLLVTAVTFYLASSTLSVAAIRSGAFLALVLGVLALILLNRTFARSSLKTIRRPNTALGIIATGVLLMLVATQTLPAVATLFRFEPISGATALIIIITTALMLGGLEALRLIVRHRLLSA